ncbi:MAG: helix-turn-helix domain-containing protein [Sandaracinaceae bacterium]|nr:helix-turn-helix domain-containing protein [Sandaracinaceae bacterium]
MISLLRRRREEAGVAQQVLAERVGVSRQALTAIEAGRQVPSTSLALSLARALGCRVEDLFVLAPAGALEVELALPDAPPGGRVILGRVGGRWVGHLAREAPIGADGVLVAAGAVEPLDEPRALERNVLVAGCAPLIGTLAGAVARRHRDARVRWLHANSEEALELLERDHVHVAGLHLAAGRSREDAAALVRERFRGAACSS